MKENKLREGKKQENKAKEKKKDLRKKIILFCVCILLLGSATFAWFSVSNSPKVTNLALVAGTSGNLKIADTAAGPFGDMVDLSTGSGGNMRNVVLNPTTTQNGRDFFAPVYKESRVTGVEAIGSSDLNTNYVYEKVFYLMAETENTTSKIRKYDIYFVGIKTDGGGTYITDVKSGNAAASAIRISFTLEDGTTVIYEPNTDIHVSGEHAESSLGNSYGSYETVKQLSNRMFQNATNNNSERIFTLTENTPTKVTMRVWVEGTDQDCVNAIAAGEIMGQIQFTSQEVMD